MRRYETRSNVPDRCPYRATTRALLFADRPLTDYPFDTDRPFESSSRILYFVGMPRHDSELRCCGDLVSGNRDLRNARSWNCEFPGRQRQLLKRCRAKRHRGRLDAATWGERVCMLGRTFGGFLLRPNNLEAKKRILLATITETSFPCANGGTITMQHKEMFGRRDSHSHRPSLCNFFLRVEDSLLALRRRGSTAVKRAGEADVRTRSARRSTFFSRQEDGTEEAEEKEIRL